MEGVASSFRSLGRQTSMFKFNLQIHIFDWLIRGDTEKQMEHVKHLPMLGV